jgi:hypothetical protein
MAVVPRRASAATSLLKASRDEHEIGYHAGVIWFAVRFRSANNSFNCKSDSHLDFAWIIRRRPLLWIGAVFTATSADRFICWKFGLAVE